MELKINIDETMFKDVLEKELEAFSKEELHMILSECIKHYFENSDALKMLFLEEETRDDYWTHEKIVTGYKPTGLLKQIVATKFDYTEPFDECKEAIIGFVKNEENLKKLMKEMVADALSKAFVENVLYDSRIRDEIAYAAREAIMDH